VTRQSNVLSPGLRAEQLVNENYRGLQAEVIGTVRHKLGARGMRLDESDLEEAYCQAWHGVCETIRRGKTVSNLTGLLVEISWRRAVDLYREQRPGQRVDLAVDEHSIELDVDAQLDDQIKLKRFIARVRDSLNPRECEAVSLCVIHGYTRPEAAEILGLTRPQIEKLMDRATKKIGGIVASINARGCGGDEWARLMQSYALGLIAEDDRDYPRAAEHVAECETCRRYVNGLRGLAAILPPVPVPFGLAGAAGAGGGILAYLQRLIGRGHGGSSVGGGVSSTASAARTVGAGTASGGAGGGGLVGTLGTGTVAKGVAVLAAGAVTIALATHHTSRHRVAANHATAAGSQAGFPGDASPVVARQIVSSPAIPVGRRPDRAPKLRSRRADIASSTPRAAAREFGFERTQYSLSTPAPSPPSPPPATESSASSASVSREFGFER
jgi:DNA-directed RNA polymerase specialized sigma24 family protein